MCSVCAEPPLLLACVNAGNEFCALADASERFAINLLTQQQTDIALVFAGLDESMDGLDRFSRGTWYDSASGAPLLTDALVSLDCELISAQTHGTHRLYIGKVVDIKTSPGAPLIYMNRGFAEAQPTG